MSKTDVKTKARLWLLRSGRLDRESESKIDFYLDGFLRAVERPERLMPGYGFGDKAILLKQRRSGWGGLFGPHEIVLGPQSSLQSHRIARFHTQGGGKGGGRGLPKETLLIGIHDRDDGFRFRSFAISKQENIAVITFKPVKDRRQSPRWLITVPT